MPQIRIQPQNTEFELIMRQRVFMIHGWGGSPDEIWLNWLKTKLEQTDFQVEVPAMPNSDAPEIEAWVGRLAQVVGETDEHTFFVGHSIGCQTILRYLESLPAEKKVGGVMGVAGWFSLKNLSEEDQLIAQPWLETQIDFQKVRHHCSKFVGIFSDDDQVMPQENLKWFEERLGAKIILEHDQGHFDEATELPAALKAIQAMN